MPIDESKLMQSIYDTLFYAYAGPPDNGAGSSALNLPGPAGGERDSTFLSIMTPGVPVDPSQFANAWSPSNTSGNQGATEAFSTAPFIAEVPLVSAVYQSSKKPIEAAYQWIVDAHGQSDELSPADKQRYQDASAFLHTTASGTDEDGNAITITVDSPAYAQYKKKKAAYNAALATYLANYFTYDITNSADQRKWALLGPTFLGPVSDAWDDLQSAAASEVEDKIGTIGQLLAGSTNALLNEARQNFKNVRRASLDAGGYYHAAYPFPANWFADSAQGFSNYKISSKHLKTSEDSAYSKTSFSTGIFGGLFSLPIAGGGGSANFSHMSSDTSDLEISFDFARVEILRPWMDTSLFELPGLTIGTGADTKPKGFISKGSLTEKDPGLMALLPTAFVVVRNVSISASWGRTDQQLIQANMHASGGLGWGPFRIGGQTSNGVTHKQFESNFDSGTLSIPGLQVIATINRLVPFCPR